MIGQDIVLLLTSGHSVMSLERKRLFAFLARNAHPATDFFGIHPNATIEVGAHVEL